MGCYCPCVAVNAFKRQPPHPPMGDFLGMHACANVSESPVRGSICLASPDLGGGGVYIYQSIYGTPPLVIRPWGRAIDDEWRSVLHSHSGRHPHGPLPPCHPPNGENTKAWDWIADGNSDPNEWSHSWVMMKSISSMEKKIIDDGNGQRRPLFLKRERNCLEGLKKAHNAD